MGRIWVAHYRHINNIHFMHRLPPALWVAGVPAVIGQDCSLQHFNNVQQTAKSIKILCKAMKWFWMNLLLNCSWINDNISVVHTTKMQMTIKSGHIKKNPTIMQSIMNIYFHFPFKQWPFWTSSCYRSKKWHQQVTTTWSSNSGRLITTSFLSAMTVTNRKGLATVRLRA